MLMVVDTKLLPLKGIFLSAVLIFEKYNVKLDPMSYAQCYRYIFFLLNIHFSKFLVFVLRK